MEALPWSSADVDPADEHAALLTGLLPSDRLCRKDDLSDEGVSALFTVRGADAELLAVLFRTDRFTPEQARQWLRQRGLRAVLFIQAATAGRSVSRSI